MWPCHGITLDLLAGHDGVASTEINNRRFACNSVGKRRLTLQFVSNQPLCVQEAICA